MRGNPALLHRLLAFVLVALPVATSARAAPYVPHSDAEVLERLRQGPPTPEQRELRALRGTLAARPGDLEVALRVARLFLERGAIEADPRYTGRAQSALGPWWSQPDPPERVLVLRATIAQRNHHFPAALQDLSRALAQAPRDGQAWLTQAAVQQATGDYAAARLSCLRSINLTLRLLGTACLTSVDSLHGELASSRALLAQMLAQDGGALPEVDRWARTSLAEMDARAGADDEAAAEYERALALGEPDAYLLASWADFLLDHHREGDVVRLLATRTRADNLLLRLAIAESRLQAPDAAAHLQQLRDRFAASRLRGDATHAREEARFLLELQGDAAAALPLAQRNFTVQREPADARVLLEAALAARAPAAAAPALAFLAANHLEDRALDPLRARFAGAAQ